MSARRSERLAQSPGSDVVLISRLDDVRWSTGFSGSAAWAVFDKTTRSGLLMVDGRYGERAADEVSQAGAPFDIVVSSRVGEHDERLVGFVGGRSLGVDPAHVSAARMTELRASASVSEETTPFDELRRRKDSAEIELMERAAAIADFALQSVVADGLAGRSEREIRNRIEYLMRERGADETAFPTIVATGPNAARPHHEPGDDLVCDGHAVVIDLGARVGGYRSDMTRTVLVGNVHGEVRALFEIVREAQAKGVAMVKSGVRGSEVDEACRSVFRSHSTEHEFVHGTGHGVGLAIHEYPVLSPRCETALLGSEVVTVEPGLYRGGVAGVRIEDLVVVGEHACRTLTHSPKDLTCPPSARTI